MIWIIEYDYKQFVFLIASPAFSSLGPETKLDITFVRRDIGINILDVAAKEHNIWYRDHTKKTHGHVSDKMFQKQIGVEIFLHTRIISKYKRNKAKKKWNVLGCGTRIKS